jgi:magnesium chelatase subunit I
MILAAIDPRIGGVLIQGPRGTAKSTIARALAALLPQGRLVTLPLGATEERVVGTLNLERVLNDSKVDFLPGLLQVADRGVLYVDEVNLLADHLVDLLLDVSASGVNVVERDGISHQHPARFVLIGTMNPDEGELRPQLLDRFGFAVQLPRDVSSAQRIEIVKRRLAFDADPMAFSQVFDPAQQRLIHRCCESRQRLERIPWTERAHVLVADLCQQANAEGVRADLVMLRAARAHAAWQQQDGIRDEDVYAVAELALSHRRKEKESGSVSSPGLADRPVAAPPSPQRTGGDWGDMPPRNAPRGPARDITSLLQESGKVKKKG